MSYEADIKIYRLRKELNSPKASNPSECSITLVGDFVLTFEEEVFIFNRATENIHQKEGQFIKPNYSISFVEKNPQIFERVV